MATIGFHMKGCGTCKLASTNLRGGRPKKGKSHAGRPKTVQTFEDVMDFILPNPYHLHWTRPYREISSILLYAHFF